MFHVKNCHSGFTGHVNEAIVHAAIARELGPDQVEPTINEMKHNDVKLGDGRGNVYWHEWSAAELRFANALAISAANAARAKERTATKSELAEASRRVKAAKAAVGDGR